MVCWNEEPRRKDAADRQAIVAQLRRQWQQGDKELIGNQGYRQYLLAGPGQRFTINPAKIKDEARYDGKWVLRSQVTGEAHKACLAAGVALPPTLREKA